MHQWHWRWGDNGRIFIPGPPGKLLLRTYSARTWKKMPYIVSNQQEGKARKWTHNRRAVKFAFLMITLDENEKMKHVWKHFAKKTVVKCFRNHTLRSRLYTSDFTLRTPHSTLHTLHSRLPTAHSTLKTPHSTPHFTLITLHSTLHTLHSRHNTLHYQTRHI